MTQPPAPRLRYHAAHWGIYEIDQGEDGQPRLKPLAADPDPSAIGLDQLDPAVARLRVQRPAVRRSFLEHGHRADPAGRGNEPFVEVGWDQALDLVATELSRVRDQHGNRAIFGGSYGWSSAGRFHHANGQLHRFLNLFGGYVRSVDSYSLGAGRALMPHIVAPMDEIIQTHTSWDVLEAHTTLFIAFGGIPLKNTRVIGGGAGRHRVRDALRRMQTAGCRFINISPVNDNLDTGGPVEWIPIRPNTDTALMLALAYVLLQAQRHDPAFLSRYTVGFERFRLYLEGQEDGVAKTPEWAAGITGIDSQRIHRLAFELADNRTMLNIAYALQRASHGEQPFWMLVTLAAMLGQIGLPGGGFGLGYGAMAGQGSANARFSGPTFPQGQNAVKDFIPVARIADLLLQPGTPFTYDGKTHLYPDIRLVYWVGGNPFHHHQDLNRLNLAWQRPESIIVHEQYWTATAKRADIVLPATITLERDDIGFATKEDFLVAMPRVVAPQGESRDDHDIFAAIAAQLGYGGRFTEGLNASGWLRKIYGGTVERAAKAGIELPVFDEFWERGIIDLSGYQRPGVMLEEFRRNPDGHPLATPSGKIEIFSETLASYGQFDCPGYPVWREPHEWLGGPLARRFPFHLLSDQPARRLHSQLDAAPFSEAGKMTGREPVYISPADAEARGIRTGDVVALWNDRGRCLAGAVVSAEIMPGVARLATGAWYDPQADGSETRGNPNVLTLDVGASSFSQGCAAQTCLVEIAKYDVVDSQPLEAWRLPEFLGAGD